MKPKHIWRRALHALRYARFAYDPTDCDAANARRQIDILASALVVAIQRRQISWLSGD